MKKIEVVGFVNWIKQIGNSMVPTASVPSYQQKKNTQPNKVPNLDKHTHTFFFANKLLRDKEEEVDKSDETKIRKFEKLLNACRMEQIRHVTTTKVNF